MSRKPTNPLRPSKSKSGRGLEAALGQVVREFRKAAGIGVAELAERAGLSPGMVSKIETGTISPSLASIRAIASALQVPVTSLFREFDEVTDATFVKSGEGIRVQRTGASTNYEYHVLGQTSAKGITVEPYLMTYRVGSKVVPSLRRTGTQFIHVLEGKLKYRQGNRTYVMSVGDSLLFQASVPHGPEELLQAPVRYLSVLSFLGGTGG